jgi:predicted ArsR family transcriptional regulator
MALRYKSQGEVHKDFHRLFCATCRYLTENYGASAAKTVIGAMAKDVYKTMHEALKKGDCDELCKYWEHYLTREGGVFAIEKTDAAVRLTVQDCPAQRHLQSLGESPDSVMCEATEAFNEALTEGSPYKSVVTRTGEFSCVQEFIIKSGVSDDSE